MTVLYISDSGINGGAMQSFYEVVKSMQKQGVKVIVCTNLYNEVNNILDKNGIKNYAINYESVLEPISPYKWKRPLKYIFRWMVYRIQRKSAIRNIEKNINLKEIDLIHTNSARNDIGCYINKKYSIPHVMHIREFADIDFKCITLDKNYIYRYNHYVTKFIAISEAVRNHWIYKGLDSDKIITIYNGVKNDNILESHNEDKKNKELKLVMVGGICEAKGQLEAVYAISLLPDVIKNHVSLDLIGWDDPKYTDKIKKYVAVNNLASKIHILGKKDNVHGLLHNYHVGLMCSVAEGFGRVTAEYMHARLGVIASNTGANIELIDDGFSGLLYKKGDVLSLCSAITKFYNDRNFLIQCSINAHIYARDNFTEEINAGNLFKLYSCLVEKK